MVQGQNERTVLASASPSSPASAVHVPALDGIRAVAVLLVVLFHARIKGFANGDIGVDVFFVLSGFLISGILLRSAARGRINFKTFYWRRALRLLPAYFTVLIVCVLSDPIHDAGGTLKGAAASIIYMSNWAAAAGVGLGLLAHTWSLSIEEQFYLVWPVTLSIILARAQNNTRRAIWYVSGILVLLHLSIVTCYLAGATILITWNSTLSRGTELLAGGLLAIMVGNRTAAEVNSPSGKRFVGMLGTASVIVLVLVGSYQVSNVWVEILVQWPLVTVLTMGMILACLSRRPNPLNRVLASKPLVGIGKVSYGIYLWHFPIFVLIDGTIGIDTWAARALGLGITAIIVPISYRFVELPFLRMKDRPRPALRRWSLLRRLVPAGDARGRGPDRTPPVL